MSNNTTTADFVDAMYGDKKLRWYQRSLINQTIQALQNDSKRVLNVLPTGGGKTLSIAASLSVPEIRKICGIPNHNTRPLRVMFASHKHRLLTQAENTFIKESNVEVITQSIFSDIPEDIEWDITVLDEAHHESCSSFQYQLEKLGEKIIIGLTATPDRADGCLIKFDTIIEPITREQAVEEGFLAETDLISVIDYTDKNKVEITTSLIDAYPDKFNEMLMFFSTKKEASDIASLLNDRGIVTACITNQTDNQIDEILAKFSNGDIQVITNCSKINEGVDVKNCSSVFLGRTFGSYPQLNQVIGRAARPDSDCVVWELVNPLNKNALDTTNVVGIPRSHVLMEKSSDNKWGGRQFIYR